MERLADGFSTIGLRNIDLWTTKGFRFFATLKMTGEIHRTAVQAIQSKKYKDVHNLLNK